MNLIRDAWIPVLSLDGLAHHIAPHQLVALDEHGKPRFSRLNTPRADLNGALLQLLIGLVQTAYIPKDELAWGDKLLDPPTEGELQAAFAPLADAFELDSAGPAFMQDFSPHELVGEALSVAALLIDSPGENALKRNTDFFVKRDRIQRLCLPCAAAALFSLQTYAPSGGAGHRTSLRGGGPLSTVVHAETLWHKCWLNVISRNELRTEEVVPPASALTAHFPWMSPTRTSDKAGTEIYPAKESWTLVYWSTPRRIRLHFEDGPAHCDLCGKSCQRSVAQYVTRNYGANYTGWTHPLTPTQVLKTGLNPVKGNPGCLFYRHWDTFTLKSAQDAEKHSARVIEALWNRMQDWSDYRPVLGTRPRVHSFGYDMDNMKARCWYEGFIPLFPVSERRRASFERDSKRLVQAAEKLLQNTRGLIKEAWYGTRSDKSIESTPFETIAARFWQETEADFRNALKALAEGSYSPGQLQGLAKSNASTTGPKEDEAASPLLDPNDALRLDWLKLLQLKSMALFDEHTQLEALDVLEPGRIVEARRKLRFFNNADQIYDLLSLARPVRSGGAKDAAPEGKTRRRAPAKAKGAGSAADNRPESNPP